MCKNSYIFFFLAQVILTLQNVAICTWQMFTKPHNQANKSTASVTQRHSGKTGVVCRHSMCAPVQCSPPGQSPAVVWGLASLPACAASPSALRVDLGPVWPSLSKTQGFSHFSQVRGAHSVGDQKKKQTTNTWVPLLFKKSLPALGKKKKRNKPVKIPMWMGEGLMKTPS